MKNKVTEILGCKYPIVQGAMGVICNPELVAAVSEAGGFGLLATALTERTEVLREQIKAIKNLTSKPFGANLFLMNPLAEKFANVLAEEGVEAVTVSGGSPRTLIPEPRQQISFLGGLGAPILLKFQSPLLLLNLQELRALPCKDFFNY